MRLSVAMICKNEEKCIAKALLSVKDADEIVILDTGSTDRTSEIVANLNLPNIRFIAGEYQWQDNFAHARNAALSRCTGDWALILDCDDWMEDEAVLDIREAIATATTRTLKVKISHECHRESWYLYPKILKRGVAFVGADHEVPDVAEDSESVTTMILGRSENHSKDPDRTLRIMTGVLKKSPNDARTLYYLAREHWYREDFEHAIHLFTRCVKLSKFPAERADAFLYLARMYWKTARGNEARDCCAQAITINADFSEALRFMGEISWEYNAKRWFEFAKLATDERVLFVRKPQQKGCGC